MSDSEDETTKEHQLKFVLVGDGTAGKVKRLLIEYCTSLHLISMTNGCVVFSVHLMLMCFVLLCSTQTSIVVRYTLENFEQAYTQTIGLDFFLKRIVLAGVILSTGVNLTIYVIKTKS